MTQLVSIIMPAYNAEMHISEAIVSVLEQTHTNWELLIINDGSSDGTLDVIKTFEDERMRVFNQSNKGVSAARNVGLNAMRGDFFCFLDADDVWPKDSIEVRLPFFEQSHVSYVDGKVLDMKDGQLLGSGFTPQFSGDPLPLLLQMDERCFFGPSWMIRRCDSVSYQFDESLKYCEDLDFYIQTVAQQRGGYTHSVAPTLYYRRSGASAMSNLDGLADGYRLFLDKLRHQRLISKRQEVYLRYRMTRIMVLSYLIGQKNILKALAVMIKYLG